MSFQPQWNVTSISHVTTHKIRKHTKVCSSWLWCVSVGFYVSVCTRVNGFLIKMFCFCARFFKNLLFFSRTLLKILRRFSRIIVTTYNSAFVCTRVCMCERVCEVSNPPPPNPYRMEHAKPPKCSPSIFVYMLQ